MDDRERRNKLAKRQEAEKQPDPARLGVSLSCHRSQPRLSGPTTRSRGPRLTVCGAALRGPRQKLFAGPSMLFLPSPLLPLSTSLLLAFR